MLLLSKLAMAMVVIASAVVQILTDPRITRRFLWKTAAAMAVFAVHCAIGLVAVWHVLPNGPETAAGKTAAILGWIGLGALGLIRFGPQTREPPRWLFHVGVADAVFLLIVALGMWSAASAGLHQP